MGVSNKIKRLEKMARPSAQFALKARAVSRGVAIGPVVWLHGNDRQFFKVNLASNDIARELKRLEKGVAATRKKLLRLASADGKGPLSGPGIFESYLLLMDDSALPAKFAAEIAEKKVNAEWAIKSVADAYAAKYRNISDETIRGRYSDIEDISDRLLNALDGSHEPVHSFMKGSIIVANELKPSTLIELSSISPKALITDVGGWTSHTFIIAREMKIAAVTGLGADIRRLKSGDEVIVDGFAGRVIVHPEKNTVTDYLPPAEIQSNGNSAAAAAIDNKTKTLDRRHIRIFANAEAIEAYQNAATFGAEGVGLFRSEFLFDQHRGGVSEAKQFAAYERISRVAGENGVKVRTFDIGADKLRDHAVIREKNPALGLRAIRLAAIQPSILRTQLRAILRASHKRNIDIVVPMVSGISEIRDIKRALAAESEKLLAAGKAIGGPRIGVMVEVPATVLTIDDILDECDFVCLGTNDLIQYLLAADRDNQGVADWYRSLHPAVIKAIRIVVEAARRAGKEAIVCGEMAGSPYYVPILIGLGATSLSMNATAVPRVRAVIEGIAAEECVRLVRSIERLRSVEEIESTAEAFIHSNWKHLFLENFSLSPEQN